jgi:hypothetical protein
MKLEDLPNELNKVFNLNFDYYFENSNLYLRLAGLDSRSLKEYINYNYKLNAIIRQKKCVSRIRVNNQYIEIKEENENI